jgi:hypothetical protein
VRTFDDDIIDPPRDLLRALVAFACKEYATIYVKYGEAHAIRALRVCFSEMAQ